MRLDRRARARVCPASGDARTRGGGSMTGTVTRGRAASTRDAHRLTRATARSQARGGARDGPPSPRSPRRRVSFDNARRVLASGKARWRSLRARTQSTVLMILSAAGITVAGHAYAILLCFSAQFAMTRELFRFVASSHEEESGAGEETAALRRTTNTLRWYWFWTLVFAAYGRFVKYMWLGFKSAGEWRELLLEGPEVSPGAWLVMQHTFLSFCAYVGGLVYFVLTLRKGKYAYQFAQFAWTHMILAATSMTGYFNVANILEGMVWFIFPIFLVVMNDIMAYICGKMFGKTPLIKISPNKTWEGFIGAFICTIVAAPFMASYLQRFRYFTCPPSGDMYYLGVFSKVFSKKEFCAPDEPFIVSDKPITMFFGHILGRVVTRFTGIASIRCSTFMLHSLVLATFASTVAPFGGFFASGFKRAFHIKDFAETIPGHGGITDRLDCQVINSCFSSIYLANFVKHVGGSLTLGMLLTKIELVSDEHMLHLYEALGKMVEARGLLPASTAAAAVAERSL